MLPQAPFPRLLVVLGLSLIVLGTLWPWIFD
jgi:hypothetical protein